ncbi:hypothetical protein NFI96_007971 [Prochilodus magdalenae]|nr:hypothetical protein NFI96_007971 [Prochilodus magdalenae]
MVQAASHVGPCSGQRLVVLNPPTVMLQQNNNNNSLCLDMAHRELLQGCGRSSAPLGFGAIGFGAIPLIKGLRAWAVSGGFNARSRRKTAGERQNHQQTDRGWKTKENLALRTPGALVTVATLKGSEGVRQTQTRCLFLKAEGCSYVCTVGSSRPTGSRAAGPRLHPNSAEATVGGTYGSARGRRASQDGVGAREVRPQVTRKWRKSSKGVKSAAESRDDGASSKPEPGQGANGDSTSQTAAPKTSDCAVTSWLKPKHKHAAGSTQPGTVHGSTAGHEKVNSDQTHLHRCEPDTSAEASSSASGSPEVYVGQEVLRPCEDSTDEDTASTKRKSDLVADVDLNHTAQTKDMRFVSDGPKPEEFGPEERTQVKINSSANVSHSSEETSIASMVTASRNPSERSRIDSPNSNHEMVNYFEGLDVASSDCPLEDASHDHKLTEVETGSKAKTDSGCDDGQPKADVRSEDMEKDLDIADTRSQGPAGSLEEHSLNNEKSQFEVIQSGETEKAGGLDTAGTGSPRKDPGQRLDLSGMEARMDKDSLNREKKDEVVIPCEEARKDEDLDVASTTSPAEEPGQGHDLAGTETEQPGVATRSEELEIDGALDVASAKDDPDQGLGVENESEAPMDKDSLKHHECQPGVVIRCEGLESAEDTASTSSPGQDLELTGMQRDSRTTTDKGPRQRENLREVVAGSEEMGKDESGGLEMASAERPLGNAGRDHDLAGMDNERSQSEMFIHNDGGSKTGNPQSPLRDPGPEERCPPQHMEVNSSLEEQWFAKSPSRGSPKAPAAVATARLLNPTFASTSNSTTAIATAPPALSRQEEVGAGFRSLRPQPESGLQSEQDAGQDWSKVATNDRPVEVGEEEEDEFGVFMQAGEEQTWTEESNELQQVPSGTHDGFGEYHPGYRAR